MGRFGSLFRKSDEKEKAEPPSNPYAQQPSTDTYTQSNSYAAAHAQQQSTDTYAQSNSYGAAQNRQVPPGLPSGPRTGLPSGPRPGSSAPPPYTQSPSLYSKDSPTFPADSKRQDSGYQTGSPAFSNYQQSPNLPSDGSSPAFSNYQQSPNLPSSGSSPAVGYGNDRFGASGGYGSNRYDNSATYGRNNYNAAPPQRTTGGYGGLGAGDNDLFAGYTPRPQDADGAKPSQPGEPYDQWENQQELTEEEKQEAEIQAKKREINQLRNETEDTMDRILGKIDYGNQVAEQSYANLGRQGEMLHSVNKKLGEASVQSRIASANVKDLQDANKSMFNFYAMSRKRRDGLNEERLVAELQEKEERQRLYQEAQQAKNRTNQRMQNPGQQVPSSSTASSNHRRFDFEDDTGEQKEQEDRIADKTERAIYGIQHLKRTAEAINSELDDQSVLYPRLAEKTSTVNDTIIKNKYKLKAYE